jgi:DNA-binding transcriptional LysR family regulator
LQIARAPDVPLQRLQAFLGGLYAIGGVRAVEVVHHDGAEALRRVCDGTLAFALVHDIGAPAGIASQPLFAGEPLVAVLPLSHPLAQQRALTPERARREQLLFPRREADPALHDRLGERLSRAGFQFAATSDALAAEPRDLVFAVAQSGTVTVAPASVRRRVSEFGHLATCVALEPEVRMPDTVVAWRAAAPPRGLAGVRAVARGLRSGPAFA